MVNKLKKILENPMGRTVAMCVAAAIGIVFAVLACVALIAALGNAWWLLAVLPFGILAGASVGCALAVSD